MRELLVHADRVAYEVVKPTKLAEPSDQIVPKGEWTNCLWVLLSFDAEDADNPEGVIAAAADDIEDAYRKVGAERILLYPYAHLLFGLQPAPPEIALRILRGLAEELEKRGYEVHRAPFGYYKKYTAVCKGHPLAELSRDVRDIKTIGPKKKGVVKGEKFHRFFLVDVDGSEYEITRQNWKDCALFKKTDPIYGILKTFVRNELEANPPKGKPRHIEYMRRLELLDYCPESDIGHMKWYPDGMLIFDLIQDYALFNIALPWGAFKMKNPLIYRTDVAEIGKLMGEFHERDYWAVGGNQRFVMRFASDPGGFPFVQKLHFTYKQMPLKVYEEAICFRREQAGEVVGLRRLRNFHMTDMHAFCKDVDEARNEFVHLCELFAELMNAVIGKGAWVLGWEGTEDFYLENRDWLIDISKRLGVPAFFKLMREMTHYYAIKNEYQVVGADEANVQVSTVQWDVKDGERFDICYVDEDGKRKPVPVIIHASSFGSIERTLYGLLEVAAKAEKAGQKPSLPLWLSPVQVRICPVAERYVERAIELAQKLNAQRIRADVDDREKTIAHKIRDAERRWIPYIVVLGEKEIESGRLSVRVRGEGQKLFSVEELVSEIHQRTDGMPWRPRYLPVRVSQQPMFVGA